MKLLFIFMSVACLVSACGKSDDPSSSSADGGAGSKGGSTSADGDKPWDDPAKPYLSDKKMGDFIDSLKDSNGPFDAVSKGKVTAFNAGARMDEFEASAKKHGFESGAEYLGAWVRINTAMVQVMQDESNESMIKTHEEMIRNAQEGLKAPGVTPEMRQSYEEQIKGSKETLAALKQPREGGVNAKDIETFKKHKAAFEEAMKKWSK